MTTAQINEIFAEFNANNPDEKLNKAEFVRLYDKLKPEPIELLDEISANVFDAFDTDDNGRPLRALLTFYQLEIISELNDSFH